MDDLREVIGLAIPIPWDESRSEVADAALAAIKEAGFVVVEVPSPAEFADGWNWNTIEDWIEFARFHDYAPDAVLSIIRAVKEAMIEASNAPTERSHDV